MNQLGRIASATTEVLLGLLRSSAGINAAITEIAVERNTSLDEIQESSIRIGYLPPDAAEQGHLTRFPLLTIYCDKVCNLQREKFRSFSGRCRVNIELRVSGQRAEDLSQRLHLYVDALTGVLERSRGDWGQGISYGGGYEVLYAAIKSGGKNYVQAARVVAEVDVSQQ